MKLKFGILWIDDNQSDEEVQILENRLSEFGFVSDIEFLEGWDLNKIKELAEENHKYFRFDLILLDYKLGDNIYGNEVAPSIRNLFPNTTILFYSSWCNNENELRLKIADQKVDGVYCSRRIDLMAKASSLIEQTAQSLNRLSGMRGFALTVVADCDELIKNTILRLYQTFPDFHDEVKELDNDVFEFLQDKEKKYKLSCKEGIKERLESYLIDSTKSCNHLRHLINIILKNGINVKIDKQMLTDMNNLNDFTISYRTVLDIRNAFAHAKEVETENGLELEEKKAKKSSPSTNDLAKKDQKESEQESGSKTSEGNLTPARYPDIRKTFVTHVTKFSELAKLIETLCDNYK